MVTVLPLIVQDPLAVMVGVVPALELVVTTKVERYVALAGAPLKVTVWAISFCTIVVSGGGGAGGRKVPLVVVYIPVGNFLFLPFFKGAAPREIGPLTLQEKRPI